MLKLPRTLPLSVAPSTVGLGARMACAAWKKQGDVVSPCGVVGLAVEVLCKIEAEQDVSAASADSCSSVEHWGAQERDVRGGWSWPGTCVVKGRRDFFPKHGGHLVAGPFHCRGILSAELKVRQVGADGRGFR